MTETDLVPVRSELSQIIHQGGGSEETSGVRSADAGAGRKSFYRRTEARMDTLVTHPMFDYRVSYWRLLEIQTWLMAEVRVRAIGRYPVS